MILLTHSMHHVAIMKKSWNLIEKILAGQKTIESRWYQTRRAPWNGIHKGDRVFFKNAGEPIQVQAYVADVLQFSLNTIDDIKKVIRIYGGGIKLVQSDPAYWVSVPKYCILIFLKNPRKIERPFYINKKGFGSAAAWLTMPDISKRIIKR